MTLKNTVSLLFPGLLATIKCSICSYPFKNIVNLKVVFILFPNSVRDRVRWGPLQVTWKGCTSEDGTKEIHKE